MSLGNVIIYEHQLLHAQMRLPVRAMHRNQVSIVIIIWCRCLLCGSFRRVCSMSFPYLE